MVTEPDSLRILLVVETKIRPGDMSQMESQMKRYMVQMSCPLGLLVTPYEIALYKDRYIGRTEDSVQEIGRFKAPSPWQEWGSRNESEFDKNFIPENLLRSILPRFNLNRFLIRGVQQCKKKILLRGTC